LDTTEYRLFRFHYLLGADWRLCCRQLDIDRGTFFHSVYRIQQKLGRVYRDLKPYGLFPLDEYFAGRLNGEAPQRPDLVIPIRRAGPVRPPLRKAA
jgi:hypothetical protein